MLTTSDVEQLGRYKLGNKFDGVFSIDHLPMTFKKTYNLIINTDPANLPGSHWISIVVKEDKTGYVFDPLGYAPSTFIQTWLNARGIQWSCNLRKVQPDTSTLCGYYCILFLHFVNMHPCENFNTILNMLFPPHVPISNNDLTVVDLM